MKTARGQIIDAAAAVAVLLACGVAAQESGRMAWWQWLWVGAVAGSVAVRRRWVVPAAVVALAASGVVLVCGLIAVEAAAGLCAAVALTVYGVGAHLSLWRSVRVLVAGFGGGAVLGLLWPGVPLVVVPVVLVPWLVGWLAGGVVRRRRELAEEVFQERAARAVAEERLRMARDVHDTVAHSLSTIAMKASVARHVAGVQPQESLAALGVIETVGREALVELRRVVGLLRADDGGPVAPGDEDLRMLADGAEQSGVRVVLRLAGAVTPPPAVRLVVYRVVQEALTNVVRHAQASACSVDVDAGVDAVTVRVADNGVAVAGGGSGYGLRGMRERVTAHGGDLQAGPQIDGGFLVAACIPYRVPGQGGRP